jgi:hypothetical protein
LPDNVIVDALEIGCAEGHFTIRLAQRVERLTAELARDTVGARAILEEGLGAPVPTLAYPYSAENEFVRQVIGELGFSAAVTCEPALSRLGDDPLRLRRFEVTGDCSPERLLSMLTP